MLSAFATSLAWAGPPPGAEALAVEDREAAAKALGIGIGAVLDGDAASARTELARAEKSAPSVPELRDVRGLAALLTGDRLAAQAALAERPSMALYLAMSEAEGPGGLSRAKEVLAKHARTDGADADPGVLFLAALAFWNEGSRDVADDLLAKAVAKAGSALDDAFAPDPIIGLVRAGLRANRALGTSAAPALSWGARLVERRRVHEAVRIGEAVLAGREAGQRGAARRLLIRALEGTSPRRALEQAELLLKEEHGDEEATVARLELLIASKDLAAARRALAASAAPSDPKLRAPFFRAKATLALEDHDGRTALEAAEEAATADPKSNVGRAILCRALVATHAHERALAFATELLGRRPMDVDAFAVLREVREAMGDRQKAQVLGLESEAYAAEHRRVRQDVDRRERVLAAVRDAEAGLGTTGLPALRSEEPFLSLPLDLVLARQGKKGTQHTARDRILTACAPDLTRFLRTIDGWARHQAHIAPYGQVETLEVSLSAPDPGRCAHPPLERPHSRSR